MSIDETKKSKKRLGRPVANTAAVNVRLPVEVLKRIDEWRRAEVTMPSRPAAIRALVEAALGKRPVK